MTPGDALRALHARGTIAAPCLPGMLVESVIAGYAHRWRVEQAIGLSGEPVLTDAATRGAVLALIREATGDAGAHIAPIWTAPGAPSRWVAVGYTGDLDYPQPTEEGAYAHLLEALATAQPAEVAP